MSNRRPIWLDLFPQATSSDQIFDLIEAEAKKTRAMGLIPCSLCGEPAAWEDAELLDYLCERCLQYTLEVGGEFPRQRLNQRTDHQPWQPDEEKDNG